MYLNALETFKEFDREALKNELISRGITAQQWNEFIKQGIVTVATGKDPQTGGIMDYTDDIKTLILDGKSAFEI